MTDTRPSPAPPRLGRGGRPRVTVRAALVVLLAACTPSVPEPAQQPPASASPTAERAGEPNGPDRTAALPDVPVQSSALDAQPAAPAAPTHLALPTLAVDLPVDPVGVAPDGQMEIPPLAERAGWYRHGAAPGSGEGTAVIAAHVDSVASEGLGPFARLRDLAVGDVVEVELSDGRRLGYAVSAVSSVPKTEVTWADVFVRDGPEQLVLVTCGGSWRSDARSYSDNVIVTLAPVGP